MQRLFLIVGIVLLSQLSFCGDLDDGIGTDSGISAGNDLQKEINVKYIIRKSKAAAQSGVNGLSGDDSDMMGTNIGGVNMIGGRTGDIYIIQEIKGDITTVK